MPSVSLDLSFNSTIATQCATGLERRRYGRWGMGDGRVLSTIVARRSCCFWLVSSTSSLGLSPGDSKIVKICCVARTARDQPDLSLTLFVSLSLCLLLALSLSLSCSSWCCLPRLLRLAARCVFLRITVSMFRMNT